MDFRFNIDKLHSLLFNKTMSKQMLIKSAPIKLSDQAGFAENTIPQDVQILRAGKYFHNGREITVRPEDLKKMALNFQENVRGIDLMIDFSHESEGEAAGWIENIYLSENDSELWAKVIWTPSGQDALINKKFRYISADFDFNYQDNETLAEYGPTLFGAGLTNRPVVKKMQPVIQLSEKTYSEEKKMDLEQKIMELMDMMKALVAKVEMMEPKKEMAEDKKEEPVVEPKMEDKKEELSDESKKEILSETAKLIEENNNLKKENAFNKLFSEGKVVQAQRDAFMKGDMIEFSEKAAKLHTTNSGDSREDKHEGDAEEQVIKLAEKEQKESGIDFGKAVAKVLKNNPKLSEAYNKKFE